MPDCPYDAADACGRGGYNQRLRQQHRHGQSARRREGRDAAAGLVGADRQHRRFVLTACRRAPRSSCRTSASIRCEARSRSVAGSAPRAISISRRASTSSSIQGHRRTRRLAPPRSRRSAMRRNVKNIVAMDSFGNLPNMSASELAIRLPGVAGELSPRERHRRLHHPRHGAGAQHHHARRRADVERRAAWRVQRGSTI